MSRVDVDYTHKARPRCTSSAADRRPLPSLQNLRETIKRQLTRNSGPADVLTPAEINAIGGKSATRIHSHEPPKNSQATNVRPRRDRTPSRSTSLGKYALSSRCSASLHNTYFIR